MVLDLFTTHAAAAPSRKSAVSRASTTAKAPTRAHRGGAAAAPAAAPVDTPEVQRLFHAACDQLSKSLKAALESPSTMFTLASYFTKAEPLVAGKPFCVALANATFLYHMQMSRIAEADVLAYFQLVGAAIAQILPADKPLHPFVTHVVRDAIFGLPSPTCDGGAHAVVLVPPHQYRAFAELACHLAASKSVPEDIVFAWQDQLDLYVKAASPLVAYRAEALLARTANDVTPKDHVRELHQVLRSKPQKINLDFLLACFERFQKAVPDAATGSTSVRMVTIHASELFLKFRSPIRRKYVERYLYPSLCAPDMQQFVQIPLTRKHLCQALLRQCSPTMGPSNPFYLCLCAIIQPFMDDEVSGAIELIHLFHTQMPHAAYVFGTLAIDTHMSVSCFSKIVMILTRAAGTVMSGRNIAANEVAEAIGESTTGVYNILFALREAAKQCALATNRHCSDVLKALRVAVQPQTINALGQFAKTAFEGLCDISVAPELLVAELGMIVHELNIREALDACVSHFHDATAVCHFCSGTKHQSRVCPVNGTVHLSGHAAVSRVLATLSECAGTKAVEAGLVALLRDPATQMDTSVHFLLFHLLSNAGQHRPALFRSIEPYVRSTLMALLTSYRERRPLVTSTVKNNVMMLHVKLAMLVGQAVDPTYLQAVLKVFAELPIRNTHDALGQWFMCNLLLRQGRALVELLSSDPLENNYCLSHPGCAPQSSIAADNAQMLLQLLDKCHNFSDVTLKLTGCCVCKLIQDFNVQAMNIVSSLLAPFGFVNVGVASLARIGFPVGAGSTFWSFILRQLKSSAPARTAILSTLAKSVSTRFRTENPSAAISERTSEATGPVFVVAMYEALKRCAPLARIITHVMALWLKQPQHTPGKFVCLAYVCSELACVLAHRASGSAAVEVDAETLEDRELFHEAVAGTTEVLESQLARMLTLSTAVRDNTEFRNLVRRVHRRARGIVAEVTGQADSSNTGDSQQQSGDESGEGAALPSSIINSRSTDVSTDNLSKLRGGARSAAAGTTAPRVIIDADSEFDGPDDEVMSLRDLIAENEGDDDIFEDDNDGPDGGDFDDDYQDTASANDARAAQPHVAAPFPGPASNPTPAPSSTTTLVPSVLSSNAADRVAPPQKPSDIAYGRKRLAVAATAAPSTASSAAIVESLPRAAPLSTVTSRGTSPSIHIGSKDASVGPAAHEEGLAHGGFATLPRSRNMSATVGGSDGRSTRRASRVDSGQQYAVDDQEEEEEAERGSQRNSFTLPPRAKALPSLQATSRSQSARRRVVGGPGGPGGHHHPHSSIAACAAPSDVVLDYLMEAQGKDSVLHELQQFNAHWMRMQQLADGHPLEGGRGASALAGTPRQQHHRAAYSSSSSNRYHAPHEAYVPAPVVGIVPVTIEGRPNNYAVPHADRPPHPSRVVMTHMNMYETERRSKSARVRERGDQDDDAIEDGRHMASVPRLPGGPGGSSREQSLAKRPRNELSAAAAATVGAVPRAMHFFLNQSTDTVLQELQGQGAGDGSPVGATPGRISLPPRPAAAAITPYGQRVLPVTLVEQQSETALRELRQAMGVSNPNTALSSTAKRYAPSTGEDTGSNRDSASWYALTGPPMPEYAADPRYSLELF